jgi:oxygen-independent coproporphyrinogen-3 oxidase
VQNLDKWETYGAAIEQGDIPLARAYRPTDEERMIREFVLQFKRGSVRPQYFADKYAVDVLARFREPLARLQQQGYLASAGPDRIALTRDGLLRVDVLLRHFFLAQHAGVRYT